MSSATSAMDQAFYTPKEVAVATGMNYEHVLAQIKLGTIPSEKFGRIYKVPRRWVRERAGSPEPAVHIVREVPAAQAPDLGPLASALEILGTAMVQAAGALRERGEASA
jgi:excisionase family DNA binding protein